VPSDATTVWSPAVIAGAVNAQELKRPLALVMQVVGSLTLTPSKVKVMRLRGAKPAPPTGSVLPTTPEVGSRPMPGRCKSPANGLGAVPEFVELTEAGFVSLAASAFVKIAEAAFAVLSDAATRAWVPAGTAGSVNAQELKLPVASAVQDLPTLRPSKVKVMVPWGTKPWPLTVSLLPTRPTLGVRLMLGLSVPWTCGTCAP
jgi:hypothetical protein